MEPTDPRITQMVHTFAERRMEGHSPHPEDLREEAGELYETLLRQLTADGLLADAREEGSGERLPRRLGPYLLISVLGEGGVGRVYKAIQSSLGRVVALKVLRGMGPWDRSILGRFRRGAQAAAQVDHDHVVKILDYGVTGQTPFIAMDYVAGPAFHEVIDALRSCQAAPFGPEHHAVLTRHGVPPASEDTAGFARRMAGLFRGVADALAAYHDRGIYHRDVKPGNLLLAPDGLLVLTDFDLAKGLQTAFATAPQAVLGTPGYMSPEQALSELGEVDGRTDVYALGIVLFEALTLERPLGDGLELMRLGPRLLEMKVPDLRERVPGLPADVCEVVARAVEPHPQDRYQTAAELAAHLGAVARGESVDLPVRPVLPRVGRWIGRRALLVGAAALVGLFLLGWAIWPRWGRLVVVGQFPAGVSILVAPEDVGADETRALAADESIELRTGRYRIRVTAESWTAFEEVVEIESGGLRVVSADVVPADAETLAIWRDLRAFLDRAPEKTAARSALRGDRLRASLPAGLVRASDVTALIAEVLPDGSGRVEIRDTADDRLLYEADPIFTRNTLDLDVPASVRENLRPGHTYRWTVRDDEGRTTYAEFRVVEDLTAEEEKRFETLAAATPPEQHIALRALQLQHLGLHKAALTELSKLLLEDGQPSTEEGRDDAWELLYRSLEALDLLDSRLAARIHDHIYPDGS